LHVTAVSLGTPDPSPGQKEHDISTLMAGGIEIKDADTIEDGRRLRGLEPGQGRT
jgi:hypothetical protein